MSESMMQRVADAISLVFAVEQERLVEAAMAVDGSLTGVADEVMLSCALAAIEAMRWPTEPMVNVGGRFMDMSDVQPFDVWVAMIDAALLPHQEGEDGK